MSEKVPCTRVSYAYIDGDGYRVDRSVLLAGTFFADDIEKIRSRLIDASGFIPGQVGLPDLQDDFVDPTAWDPERDHPVHVLEEIVPVDAVPTPGQPPAAEFLAAFLAVKWDLGYLPPFHDRMAARGEQPAPVRP